MIKASVILAAAFVITLLLRKRAAAERHLLWASAIVSAALLPILSSILPAWQPAFATRAVASLPRFSGTPARTADHRADVIFRAQSIERTANALEEAAPFVWLAGSIVFLVFAVRGVVRQARTGLGSVDAAAGPASAMLNDLAAQLRCHRAIRLKRSIENCMPMTWGVFRPKLLLPASAEQWSSQRLRVVIAHELAHVQRMDWLFQMLAQLACIVYWFNPLFWIATNRLCRESERACDDAVLRLGVDARDYATHLFEIARDFCQSGAWSAALAMARRSALEERFASLLKAGRNRNAAGAKSAVLIALTALITVIPVAAMRISNAGNAAVPVVDQYTTPPLYSDEARSQGIEGKVTLEVTVGVNGKPKSLQVVSGLGYGLDQNALVAVRDWHFVPAHFNGKPIESPARVDVEFSLKNAELNELIANDMATRIGPGVTPPQVVHRADPIYPESVTGRKPEGAVVLDAVIPEDGIPRVIRVIRSLDWQFDEIAITALKQWRFSPAMTDGKPVKVRMNVAVEFTPRS